MAKNRGGDYEGYKERQAEISRERSAAGREIGPLPAVANPKRRQAGRKSLRFFAETYFPGRFFWPFSRAHITAIERMERCSEVGGRFASAMPRGSGKTALAEVAALRAILYGLRRYVVLVQATEPLAGKSLKKIQRELESNDLLAEDFPEVCHPIRSLERIHNRARGQTLDGAHTLIEWTANGVVLPTVEGSLSSGAILHVAGITGAVRGLSAVGPKGEILRPDMVLIDDAQTRESAKSPTQTSEREAIITDDILGLSGPGTEIAAMVLCTVIYPNDLSDRFLDHDKHPDWQGVRTKMLEKFPSNMELWDQYSEIRRESFKSGDEGNRATEFYLENSEAMDVGAVVSWPERMKPTELSGIQSAMNLYYDNPRGFKSEYQNEPDPPGGVGGSKELISSQVASRLAGTSRNDVPRESDRVTAFIDCGGELLWYAVCAWDKHYGGVVIDYGSWPRQTRTIFAASDPRPGMSLLYPGLSETQRLFAGLKDLVPQILGRTYYREKSGEELTVDRLMIDCGWQSQTVYQFVRQSQYNNIYPSKGIGRTATARGVSEWRPRPGERSGFHWRLTTSETGKGRMVQFDPDAWKSFLFDRLTTAAGGHGCLQFWGKKQSDHEMIAEHCAAEYAEPITLRGATFDKWLIKPHRPDNHLLDCLVGCAVGASVQGLLWDSGSASGNPVPANKPRQKLKLSELYASKHGK